VKVNFKPFIHYQELWYNIFEFFESTLESRQWEWNFQESRWNGPQQHRNTGNTQKKWSELVFFFHFVSIFPIAWDQRSSHSSANSSINPVTQCHVLTRAASEAGIPVDTQGTLSYLMISGEAIDFHFWAGSTITEIIELSSWMGIPVTTEIRDPAGRNASATSRCVLLILRHLYNTQTPFPTKRFEAKSLRALCGTILRCKIWCLFNMPIWRKIAAEVASNNSLRQK